MPFNLFSLKLQEAMYRFIRFFSLKKKKEKTREMVKQHIKLRNGNKIFYFVFQKKKRLFLCKKRTNSM